MILFDSKQKPEIEYESTTRVFIVKENPKEEVSKAVNPPQNNKETLKDVRKYKI